jgi:hypothetical protein
MNHIFKKISLILGATFVCLWLNAAAPIKNLIIDPDMINTFAQSAEKKLNELADSLGFTVEKNIALKNIASFISNQKPQKKISIQIALKDKQGKKCAYIMGDIFNLESQDQYAGASLLEVSCPEFRGSKIALFLCAMFYNICREMGCKKIRWLAKSYGKSKITHKRLIAFYKQMGAVELLPSESTGAGTLMEYSIHKPKDVRLPFQQPKIPSKL